jgi:hypothetical protein
LVGTFDEGDDEDEEEEEEEEEGDDEKAGDHIFCQLRAFKKIIPQRNCKVTVLANSRHSRWKDLMHCMSLRKYSTTSMFKPSVSDLNRT